VNIKVAVVFGVFGVLYRTVYRVDHKVVPLGANKKTTPKFTGVPVTQYEKIILM
jgi:hypothetical protein